MRRVAQLLGLLAIPGLCACVGTGPIEVAVTGAPPATLKGVRLIGKAPGEEPSAFEALAFERLRAREPTAAPLFYVQVAHARHPAAVQAFDPATAGGESPQRRRKRGELQVVTVQVLSAADGGEVVRVRASQVVRRDRGAVKERLLEAALDKLNPAATQSR
jgi:hypothetical protein